MFKFSTTTATSNKVAQGSQVLAILQTKQYRPVERACGITTWLHKGEPSTARQSTTVRFLGVLPMAPRAGKMLWHLLKTMVAAEKKRGKSETTPPHFQYCFVE